MPKDGMSVVHFSSFAPVTEMILQSLPAVKDKEDQKAPAIKNFDQLRQRLNSHARFLIWTLSFFRISRSIEMALLRLRGRCLKHKTALITTSMPRICLLSDNWPFCDNMTSAFQK